METTLFFDRQKNICNFLEWLRFSQQYPTLISNEISFIGRDTSVAPKGTPPLGRGSKRNVKVILPCPTCPYFYMDGHLYSKQK